MHKPEVDTGVYELIAAIDKNIHVTKLALSDPARAVREAQT